MDKTLIRLKEEVKKLVQDVVDKTELRPINILINYGGTTKIQDVSIVLDTVE